MRFLGGWLAVGALTAIFGAMNSNCGAAEVPASASTTKTAPAKTGWVASYEEAQKSAKSLGVPLLLHFHASWCGPCQQMERSVLNTPGVTGYLGTRVIAVKINTDQRPDLTSRFGVGALPSDVFVTPDGAVLSRAGGFTSADTYQRQILQVSHKYFAKRLYELVAGTAKPASDAAQASLTVAEADIALRGFSPVAITEKKQWLAGSGEFAWKHAGIVYHMASADELARFKKSPESFVPGWLGHDPLAVLPALQSVVGDVRFAAFFRNRLYLLSSEANRKKFLENPAVFEDLGK